ncbi:MAG: hypothetical protein WCC60_19680 [Ilumatobacteraceae bacterium]
MQPRPGFVEGLSAELETAWPAPMPVPPPAPQPADSVDVWAAFESEPAVESVGSEPPAVPTASAPVEVGRRRGAWLAIAALVIAAGAGGVYATTRNPDKDATVAPGGVLTTDSTLPGETAALGDTAAPTSADPATTDPTQTAAPAFDPACEETVTGAARPSIDESAADTLSELSASATLTVHLPKLVASWDGWEILSSTVRVRGGMIFVVRPSDELGAAPTSAMVAAVGADGSLWWVRCFPSAFVLPIGDAWAADRVAISTNYEEWNELSLVDGTVGANVPRPPMRDRSRIDYEPSKITLGRSLDDTTWVVVGVDAAGTELWRDETIHPSGGEAITYGTVGGVSFAAGCTTPDPYTCSGYEMRAYDPDDGAVLWRLDGVSEITIAGDGRAIVPVDDGYRMMSLSDGAFIDGQQWPSDTFNWRCCGDSDTHWNDLYGGVVVNTNDRTLTVWFPESLGLGSHEISLP